jgi:hypothetical protein
MQTWLDSTQTNPLLVTTEEAKAEAKVGGIVCVLSLCCSHCRHLVLVLVVVPRRFVSSFFLLLCRFFDTGCGAVACVPNRRRITCTLAIS